MAIPSMSRSSRLIDVSTLLYLDEGGTSTTDTECGEESNLQPRALKEPQTVRVVEDTGISNFMAKGEGGQSL